MRNVTDANAAPARTPVMRTLNAPITGERPGNAPVYRQTFRLNGDWLFRRDDPGHDGSPDGAWESVALPHTVRPEPLNASGGRNFQGVCWYRRKLAVPHEWAGKVLYLRFDGAMQVATVWVNGRPAATHHCGYTPFTIDITHLVRPGHDDNEIRVRLDNRDDAQVPPGKPQGELDFCYFGGLYRPVHLDVLDPLHVSDPILADTVAGGGIFVSYPLVTSERATVRIRTDLRNAGAVDCRCVVRHELIDSSGNLIASGEAGADVRAGRLHPITLALDVPNPLLWHPDHPHLYHLRTTAYDGARPADDVVTRVGIRHFRVDKDHGLFINGQSFRSMGANRHQDHPYVSYALPDSAHWRDVRKLREAGFTSFRSHYPQAPSFMDACDELGMLTIVSNPGWQFVGDDVFRHRAIRNAREMVRRDRNRPSVLLWEAALNESDNRDLGAALQQAVHEEYPGDQCFTAGDRETGFEWRGQPGWDVDYLHNDGTKPYWIREWGDQVDNWSDQQSGNRVARGWGEVPMLTQAWSYVSRMDEILVGHHGSSSGEGARRLCGACLWAGIDCQRGYHHQPFYGGPLDAFRLPKFSYYFFQSQRPPHVHVPGLDDGPMVFIANFATFLSPTTLTVFSNCQEVRLLHGGREVARQRPDAGHRIPHPPFTFRVAAFAAGQSTMYMSAGAAPAVPPAELVAEGLIDGVVVARHTVRPPGAPARIVLEADLCGRPLAADGSDWVRVYAKVCDARGTVHPFADDLITFDVQGEGELIGDATIGANPARAEAGIATALVRSTPRPGPLRVTATSFGLATGTLEIASERP